MSEVLDAIRRDVVTAEERVVDVIDTTGPRGPRGLDGRAPFIFTQDVAAAEWDVFHDLDGFPNVTVVDEGGFQVVAEVQYVDAMQVVIRFVAPTQGKAYLS
jgi:hypothetical protein